MQINILAVILAALSAFFLGFIWYTVIFAKPWQKEIGMGENAKDVKTPNLGKVLALSFIMELLMAFILAAFLGDEASVWTGMGKGAVVGFAWVGLAFGVNYLFEGKSLKLWLINAGYNTVVFTVMGAIIAVL